MDTTILTFYAAHTACLARVFLGFGNNADTPELGLVREHFDYPVERPFVELLVPAVSPVLAVSNVLEVPHDDRGDAASFCIADKRFGQTVKQMGTLPGPFLIKGA
jgi:hypothetical protein